MRVQIVKNRRDVFVDNMTVMFSGIHGYMTLGLIAVGLILGFMGQQIGFMILAFPVAGVLLRLYSIFKVLKQIDSEVKTEYILEDGKIEIKHPSGKMDIPIENIIRIKENKKYFTLTLDKDGISSVGAILMREGATQGDMNLFMDEVKEELRISKTEKEIKGSFHYQNKSIDDKIYDESHEEQVDDDEVGVEETPVEEVVDGHQIDSDLKIKTDEDEQQEALEIEKVREGIDIEQNDESVNVQEMDVIEGNMNEELIEDIPKEVSYEKQAEENQLEQNQLEENQTEENQMIKVDDEKSLIIDENIEQQEMEKKEIVEVRNIVKFKSKMSNDIKRQYKMYFSRISSILLMFLAITTGSMLIFYKKPLFGGFMIAMALLMCIAPVIDVLMVRKQRSGEISIGIDSDDYLVINTGHFVTKVHKDQTAVGKTDSGEVVLSIASIRNRPFSILKEEITGGDIYELFKILKVGKVNDFNILGVLALGFTAIAYAQLPMVLIWKNIGNPGIGVVVNIIAGILSLVLGVMAVKKTGKMKKQANWAVTLDVLLVVLIVFMYFRK